MLVPAHIVSISAALICWLTSSVNASTITEKSDIVRLPLTRRVVGQDGIPSPTLFGKRDATSVPVYNAIQYLVDVGVGTPAVPMTVAIDTGSADFWIPSTSCPVLDCPYSRFDPSQSSSLKQDNTSVSIDYMVATVSGSVATDKIQLGSVTIEAQQICLASQAANVYASMISPSGKFANGVIGLGYQDREGKPWDRTGVVQNFNGISSFSLYVDDPSVSVAYALSQGGELILGGTDSSKFTGDNLTYLPSAPNAFTSVINQQWAIYGQRVQVVKSSGKFDGADIPDNTPVIISTMLPYTTLPRSVAEDVVEALVGKDNYAITPEGMVAVKCRAAQESPARLQFQLSGSNTKSAQPIQIDIPASALILTEAGDACIFGIMARTEVTGSPSYILGESILRHLYLDFSISEHKVGLAPTVNGKATVATLNNADKGAAKEQSLASPQLLAVPMTVTLLVFAAAGLLLA